MFRFSVSSASLRSFGGGPLLREKRIWHSISEDPLTGPRCSAVMNLSTAHTFFEVGTVVTCIVFLIRSGMVHCYTGSVLAPDTAIFALLGSAGG